MASACLLFAPFMNAIPPLDRPAPGTLGVGLPGLMRKCTHARVWATFLVTILLLHSAAGEDSLRSSPGSNGRRSLREHPNHMMSQERVNKDFPKGLYASGSSLPDCSHACGPCFPCKRVMVSYKCSIAESCPIVYRCLCKGKYYHVPSN